MMIEQLRVATKEYTRTREPQVMLAFHTGMLPSTLSRFMSGKGGLSLESADRLATYMGLTLKRCNGEGVKA